MLNLQNELDRRPAHLSGGQRQRVAMGRAIVREPSLFLFDEPLSNLDAKLRVSMRAEIKALHQKLGNTIIYVTHDQVEAMTMADRIVVMNGGRIEQQGSPAALYDEPANVFVAGFLGSPAMNFIEGVYDAEGGVTTTSGLRVPAPSRLALAGQKVVVGLRPEHLEVVGPEKDGVSARVDVVEPTGQDTLLHTDFGGTPLTVSVRRRLIVRPGETIKLASLPSDAHLFSRESGKRLDAWSDERTGASVEAKSDRGAESRPRGRGTRRSDQPIVGPPASFTREYSTTLPNRTKPTRAEAVRALSRVHRAYQPATGSSRSARAASPSPC